MTTAQSSCTIIRTMMSRWHHMSLATATTTTRCHSPCVIDPRWVICITYPAAIFPRLSFDRNIWNPPKVVCEPKPRALCTQLIGTVDWNWPLPHPWPPRFLLTSILSKLHTWGKAGWWGNHWDIMGTSQWHISQSPRDDSVPSAGGVGCTHESL